LSTSSALFALLCNGYVGNCDYHPEVSLTTNYICFGDECNVDEMCLVKVQSNPAVFYEYLRPSCVDMALYDSGRTIHSHSNEAMCANPNMPIAKNAHCINLWGSILF
jgi:hypothetical protein